MTVNSTRDFIPPEPFEGQNYKPRYARNKSYILLVCIFMWISYTTSRYCKYYTHSPLFIRRLLPKYELSNVATGCSQVPYNFCSFLQFKVKNGLYIRPCALSIAKIFFKLITQLKYNLKVKEFAIFGPILQFMGNTGLKIIGVTTLVQVR